jgi:hypothetical protein
MIALLIAAVPVGLLIASLFLDQNTMEWKFKTNHKEK